MERELWRVVYTKLKRVARRFDQKYVHHQPWRVAAVLGLRQAQLGHHPTQARAPPLGSDDEPAGRQDRLPPVPQRPDA